MDFTNRTAPSTDLSNNVSPETPQPQPPRLTEIQIRDDNDALNVMVGFLDVAQKRGAYSIDESSKIWECIRRFIQKQAPTEASIETSTA